MKVAQKNDLMVGVFVILVVATVVAALIKTQGLGVRHRALWIHATDVSEIRVDTKIYLQGLEVGRITQINPKPASGGLEFQIRADILAQFPDGTPLTLRRGTDAELEINVLGGSTLLLDVHGDSRDTLRPGEVIELHRHTPAMEAFSSLASGLKEQIAHTLEQTTRTLTSVQHLADSATIATGTARRFVSGIQPGTERTLNEAAASMARMREMLDTTDVRSGVTLRQLNATFEQSRRLMASTDSLTRLLTAMGGENRPAIREVLENSRLLSQQTTFLMEALSRRPMRVMSGVDLPESLTSDGRARRALQDSILRRQRADSARAARNDTARSPQP
ncbi:MAG: MlaD family protein [Gemmatimonadales bacterium]